jgi:hypothetical protein
MVIANNILIDIKSEADLQELEILPGENEFSLLYAPGAENKVILRKCLKAESVTNKSMPKLVFLNIHRNGLANAGYPYGSSIYSIRRGLNKKVNDKITSPKAPSTHHQASFTMAR